MPWAAAAAIGGAVIGGAATSKAAKTAANAQTKSAAMGTAENRRQFDRVQSLLSPYVNAGRGGLMRYEQLSGIDGNAAQRNAIGSIQRSAEFNSLTQQGEDAILQNASATGGLRGGNTQRGLAEFRSNLLTSLIERQLGRFGGIAQMGQNSAAGVGSAAMSMGQANAGLMQQAGAAQAGAAVAGGNAIAGAAGSIGGILASRIQQSATQAAPAGDAHGYMNTSNGGFGSGVVYGNQDLGAYF